MYCLSRYVLIVFMFLDVIGFPNYAKYFQEVLWFIQYGSTLCSILFCCFQVISSIVIGGENYSLTTSVINQNDSAIIHNECTKIEYDQLQGFAQFILGAADSMAFPNSLFEKYSENLLVGKNKLQHPGSDDCISKDSCNCDVVSITPNDLNILVSILNPIQGCYFM